MRTLNRQRANLVFSNLLNQLSQQNLPKPRSDWQTEPLDPDLKYPSPKEISAQESVFERDGVLRWNGEVLGYCRLGVSLQTILNCFSRRDQTTGSHTESETIDFLKLLDVFSDAGYIVWYDVPSKTFLVVMEEGANTLTQLSAWMFALQFAKFEKIKDNQSLIEALGQTRNWISQFELNIFRHLGEMGWDLDVGALEVQSGTRIKVKNSER